MLVDLLLLGELLALLRRELHAAVRTALSCTRAPTAETSSRSLASKAGDIAKAELAGELVASNARRAVLEVVELGARLARVLEDVFIADGGAAFLIV